jgi:hypothetical protein
VNRKSVRQLADADWIKRIKNGFEPFSPVLLYSNDFSIYLLHLSPYKVRVAFSKHCPTHHDQTLPKNAVDYRFKSMERNNLLLCAISHASLFAGIRSRWQR